VPELSVISELTGTNFAEIKYSRDGSLFAVVDADKGVQLFDAANAYAPMRVLSRQHISGILLLSCYQY
jgi:hypothetical protein